MATRVDEPADDRAPPEAPAPAAGPPAAVGAEDRQAAPASRRAWIHRWGPVAVLAAMVVGYFALFGFLVYRQQSNFGTFGFDIGIRDQGIWLVAHGHTPFMTVRGLDFFAENVEPVSLLFVPFYWLGAGPHLLIVVHTAVLSLGAVPLWLLARDRFGRRWLALAPAAAYLLYPALQWVTWWAYHPDSMAITPLLFAWWLAVRRRWGWFAVAVAVALACKEDVALAVLVLGLMVAFVLRPAGSRRRERRARHVGLVTAGVAVAWFLVATHLIIPWRNHHAPPFYESFFPSFGHSSTQIAYNLVRHPSRALHLALRNNRRHYDLQVFAPVAFLPFFGLPALLVAGPQFGVNTIVEVQNGATIASQYASLIIVGVFLGTVEGMAWLAPVLARGLEAVGVGRSRGGAPPSAPDGAPGERRLPEGPAAAAGLRQRRMVTALLGGLSAVLIATSLWTAHVWGLSPLSRNFHSGLWVAHSNHSAALNTELRAIGANDGVSVTYYVTPHVTHRQYVYEFPNPWINSYYGNTDSDVGRPDKVSWLLLDRATLGPTETALFERLTAPGGPFQVVEDDSGVVLAHRVGPG